MSREYWTNTFEEEARLAVSLALQKDNGYTLFRSEDWLQWVTFTAVFTVLIIADNCAMKHTAMTLRRAFVYTLFWVLCAFAFCGGIFYFQGGHRAFMWMSGYMLEWMLSFDNLFVFHVIFQVYGTPADQKHKPLYLGICGAVFFRLLFIFIGEYLMHAMMFMHLLFGGFLVYTGIKTALVDEDDDEDPSKHPLVQWMQTKMPFVPSYDAKGSFFVRVPVDEDGKSMLPELDDDEPASVNETDEEEANGNENEDEEPKRKIGTVDFEAAALKVAAVRTPARYQLRATMLLLVVFCLEVSDLLFAVDSVSAIVAQVNDLFLAYTSAVFAMLGLRATFFIIDSLVHMFTLLKYGVAIVLVFIGVKLMIGKMYHIPPSVVCVVLVTSIFGSMLASVAQEELKKRQAEGKLYGALGLMLGLQGKNDATGAPDDKTPLVSKLKNSPEITERAC